MDNQFKEQYNKMVDKIAPMTKLSIGTLGPESTSSYQALLYYINNLDIEKQLDYQIKLYDNFTDCLNEIDDGKIDLALVPSAYGDITKFFWNPNLTSIYTFSFPTPEYGIVSKIGYNIKENNEIKVASCEPVKFLLYTLLDDEIRKHEHSMIITESTTKALESLIDGEADIAITNKTSFKKYADEHEIQFITECFSTEMVWSIFSKKDFFNMTKEA